MNISFELTCRLLTTTEAAFFLRMSARTLEKYRVIGSGPQYRKLGRKVVYAISDLETWTDARRCGATDETPSAAR